MTREVRTKGYQAELGIITQPLALGRVQAPLILIDRINDYCRTADGKFKRNKILSLLELGLDAVDERPKVQSVFEKMRSLRSVLRSAGDVDLDPHPCPMNVDPTWWNEKEAERLDRSREEILRVLHEVGRIVGEIGQ